MQTYQTKVFLHESDLDAWLNKLLLNPKGFVIAGYSANEGRIYVTVLITDSVRNQNKA